MERCGGARWHSTQLEHFPQLAHGRTTLQRKAKARGLNSFTGSLEARRSYRCLIHTSEALGRKHTVAAIRACHVQADMSSTFESLLVRSYARLSPTQSSPISSSVDIRSRTWTCPFCLQRNQLPPHYKDISAEQIPPELHQENTTIEYRLARPAPAPPIFLFCVDTCQDAESLEALKTSLIQAVEQLPPYVLVGLITFGTMVGSLRSHIICGSY